jgi:hypothetical protein
LGVNLPQHWKNPIRINTGRQRGKGSKHSLLISGGVSVCQTEFFG